MPHPLGAARRELRAPGGIERVAQGEAEGRVVEVERDLFVELERRRGPSSGPFSESLVRHELKPVPDSERWIPGPAHNEIPRTRPDRQ